MPTQDQLLSVLRWALTALGTFLTTNGTISASAWQQISGLVITVAPFVWGLLTHTQTATANAAAAMTGVQVTVSRDASPALQRLARDPAAPDVVSASTPQH